MAVAAPPRIALRPAEITLLRLAVDLGAAEVGGPLTPAEQAVVALAAGEPARDATVVSEASAAIRGGADPLGDALCVIRPGAERRDIGAFYTPPAIVDPMVDWVLRHRPVRVVDAGSGSGRYAAAVLRRDPTLPVIAVDLDPVATLLTRAAVASTGATQATVLNADFTRLELPSDEGVTAWIGNPPYVRHHDLSPATKAWAAEAGRRLGVPVSSLAGLHALFFLATADQARSGDVGSYITSSEWLDVGYGVLIRELLTGVLGLETLHVLDPRAVPFADAMTTGAIASFVVGGGSQETRVAHHQAAAGLSDLAVGNPVSLAALREAPRWSRLVRDAGSPGVEQSQTQAAWTQEGKVPTASGTAAPIHVTATTRARGKQGLDGRNRLVSVGPAQLGEIGRVHRGLVTGANRYFVLTREQARRHGVEAWCRPAITSAEEVLDSGGVIHDSPERLLLFCPSADVDRAGSPTLNRYLRRGERRSGDRPAVKNGYICTHRRPWWNHGRISTPPIVASYMARRPPAFARNPDGLVLLNVVHGIYPPAELSDKELDELVAELNQLAPTFVGSGRTYHGGLEKFEPREMEQLVLPDGRRWVR